MRALATLFAALLLAGCTSFFFQPSRALVATPARFGVEFRQLDIEAADGTVLRAWYMPARGPARGSILFLHGNAENISTHFANVVWLPAEGFNVLALDYRGYGASEGSPSLAGAQLDIDAALRALLARPDVDPDRIVVFGQSLGAALAIYYVAHSRDRAHIRALVADSAFADYRAIAREKLAGFFLTWPLQWLPWLTVDDDYSPAEAVGAVSPIPLLIVQGDADRVVPVANARRLFALAREPKQLWIVPGAGHIGSLRSAAERARLAAYLRRVVEPARPGAIRRAN